MSVAYRPAEPRDLSALMGLIRELAVFEKLEDILVSTEDDMAKLLFGVNAPARCLLAEIDGEAVGFCAYYYTFSTFQGRPGLFIHDVYVRETQRGAGIGKGFFRELARIAQAEGCRRIEWQVLDWNAPAIAAYDKMGGEHLKEWRSYRLEDEGIARLAA